MLHHVKYTGIDPTDPDGKRSIGPMKMLGIGDFEVGEVKEVDDDQYHKIIGTNEPFFEKSNKAEYEKWIKKKELVAKKEIIEPINTAVVEPPPVGEEPKGKKK